MTPGLRSGRLVTWQDGPERGATWSSRITSATGRPGWRPKMSGRCPRYAHGLAPAGHAGPRSSRGTSKPSWAARSYPPNADASPRQLRRKRHKRSVPELRDDGAWTPPWRAPPRPGMDERRMNLAKRRVGIARGLVLGSLPVIICFFLAPLLRLTSTRGDWGEVCLSADAALLS